MWVLSFFVSDTPLIGCSLILRCSRSVAKLCLSHRGEGIEYISRNACHFQDIDPSETSWTLLFYGSEDVRFRNVSTPTRRGGDPEDPFEAPDQALRSIVKIDHDRHRSQIDRAGAQREGCKGVRAMVFGVYTS